MCSSCVPCEKLSRKTSTPASINSCKTRGSLDAGPIVATIFVRTLPDCSLSFNVIYRIDRRLTSAEKLL